MVAKLIIITAALCAATACTPNVITRVETVEVAVPVPVARQPPPELQQPYAPAAAQLPAFVAPGHPDATVALTKTGEARLKQMLRELVGRVRAWEVWAMRPHESGM